MQAIHAENVNWKSDQRGVREAKLFSALHGSEETRIDMIEVPAGGYIPAHRHSSRREFITILLSAGAQLQIGDRTFRPTAGQVFHREPGDVLALTNDSHHPFRYSVVRFGYESSDVEILQDTSDFDDEISTDFGEHLDTPDSAIETPTAPELEEPKFAGSDSVEDLEATVEMEALPAGKEEIEEPPSPEVDDSKSSKGGKTSKSKTSKGKASKSPSKGSKSSKDSKGSKDSKSK